MAKYKMDAVWISRSQPTTTLLPELHPEHLCRVRAINVKYECTANRMSILGFNTVADDKGAMIVSGRKMQAYRVARSLADDVFARASAENSLMPE